MIVSKAILVSLSSMIPKIWLFLVPLTLSHALLLLFTFSLFPLSLFIPHFCFLVHSRWTKRQYFFSVFFIDHGWVALHFFTLTTLGPSPFFFTLFRKIKVKKNKERKQVEKKIQMHLYNHLYDHLIPQALLIRFIACSRLIIMKIIKCPKSNSLILSSIQKTNKTNCSISKSSSLLWCLYHFNLFILHTF